MGDFDSTARVSRSDNWLLDSDGVRIAVEYELELYTLTSLEPPDFMQQSSKI